MHLAEPKLYWRIKTISGWRYVAAKYLRSPYGEIYRVEHPPVPGVNESEN
jgi:hypothetical protein